MRVNHKYRTFKRDLAQIEAKIADTKADLIRWVVGVGLLQITVITALMLRLTGKD
jgi:hypothetical protein